MRALLLATVVLVGCRTPPKAPDAEGARAAYTARAARIAAFEATMTSGGADRQRATSEAGAHSCGQWTGKPGNVHPDEPEALRLDGRRIGWGIYQTTESETWRPAIQVLWSLRGYPSTELELCFLLDDA